MIFIGKLDEKPWNVMKAGIPTSLDSVAFPMCPEDTGSALAWADIIEKASSEPTPVIRTRDEMATIIYTSGSTGK